MKTVGLITEYNPFHNGHLYHLNHARKNTDADYVVVIMSGNFLQRGVPALLEKQERTLMALKNGADLVLELPVPYAAGSAEYFALGAVSTLDQLDIIDTLCFGSECADTKLIQSVSSLLLNEPENYQILLKHYVKQGLSFPAAREKALLFQLTFKEQTKLTPVLSNPNAILGVEYCKAIQKLSSSIQPIALKRMVSGYHDESIIDSICSATAIRHALFSTESLESFRYQVPPSVYQILKAEYKKTFPIEYNDFSSMLKYRLLSREQPSFENYLDISSDMSDRIRRQLHAFSTIESFASLLKNKQYTLTRIQRALLHLLLNIKKEDMALYLNHGITYYARVLGFRKSSTPLLSEIKKNSRIPLLSKLADADNLLSPIGRQMLQQDIFASDIYHTIVTDKYQSPLRNEYTKGIVLVD